jgi:tetratricopeptide (TPR) repeat protein
MLIRIRCKGLAVGVMGAAVTWAATAHGDLGAGSGAQQAESPTAATAQSDEQSRVQAIYARTKSAQSATDFTAIIDECESALAGPLSESNTQYLKGLASWALVRRGAHRIELAEDLRAAGNDSQADACSEQALTDLGRAIELEPTRWRAYLTRGVVYGRQGKYEEAIADFNQVIAQQPAEPLGWFNRAELRYTLGQYTDAIADYSHVLDTTPGDMQALTGRGHARLALGQLDEALEDYEVVLKLLPRNPWALANRGDAYQALGRWDAAHDDYVAALEIEPIGYACRRMAWLMATVPDDEFFEPQTALTMAGRAIELEGETAATLDVLAAAQAATGDFESAQATQGRAIEMAQSERTALEARLALYDAAQPYQQETVRR